MKENLFLSANRFAGNNSIFVAPRILGLKHCDHKLMPGLTAAAKYLQKSTMYLIQVYPLSEEQVRHTAKALMFVECFHVRDLISGGPTSVVGHAVNIPIVNYANNIWSNGEK